MRELGILNVDKKPNSKLRYTQDYNGLEDEQFLKEVESISKSIPSYRVNDCTAARPTMRDNEHTAIHQIASNDSSNISVTTPPHLVSQSSNGYSNNDCLPYNINGENEAELSHCRSI